MKYIVTGGAGFIGSNIVKKLVARGDNVTVIDNLNTGKEENLVSVSDKITFLKDNILNLELLEQETDGIDGIFHQAALASVQDSGLPEGKHGDEAEGGRAPERFRRPQAREKAHDSRAEGEKRTAPHVRGED